MMGAVDLAALRRALQGTSVDDVPLAGKDRRAAVAAILRGTGNPEVLLIRRAVRPRDRWSGHMAFPGGLSETHDPTLLATARRETLEEIGLDLQANAELVGRLDDVPAIARGRPAGIVISPFVFVLAKQPEHFVPNHEVEEIVWAPLDALFSGEAATTHRYEHDGKVFHLPAFDVNGRIVWGLTYQMLQSLFAALRSED